jgi:hypothetical protein
VAKLARENHRAQTVGKLEKTQLWYMGLSVFKHQVSSDFCKGDMKMDKISLRLCEASYVVYDCDEFGSVSLLVTRKNRHVETFCSQLVTN